MELTTRLVGDPGVVDAPARWAASGAMWLTGRPDGPLLPCPRGVPTTLDGVAARLATMTGGAVSVDGTALLGERAALAGLERGGDISCGGSTRLLRAADDWVALALARTDDLELLPAWLTIEAPAEPWPAVTRAVAGRRAADLVATGAELGLAVARLGERAGDRRAVVAASLGASAPATRLDRLCVVDLSSLWAGPLCGQLLAAAGMEVIKVESAGRPDGARSGTAAFFDLLNAGKSSVALDFRARLDRQALRRLLLAADVVIESSRRRALEQLGIDVAEIAGTGALRVWVSITAHGRREPHHLRAGFGDDAAVAGGLVAVDGSGPVFCADAAADPATGLLAATAVVDRLRAGGRWMLDVALARTAALMAVGDAVAPAIPAERPRARPVTGRAPALGRDTRVVLDRLGAIA